jgi:hypothetical protein
MTKFRRKKSTGQGNREEGPLSLRYSVVKERMQGSEMALVYFLP